MLVTETEAKTKWCPMVRQISSMVTAAGPYGQSWAVPTGVGINREAATSVHEIARCIGSGCMMWRYDPNDGTLNGDPLGYCGLAGP